MADKIRLQYLNKATTARLNKMLKAADYSEWPGDKTTAEPHGYGEGYASNCIDYIAGSDPDDQREVANIISSVTGVSGRSGQKETT